jgi:D-threo-aldose 1-dehydrogenase
MRAAERVALGRTGLAISRLGIGGGSLASAAGAAGVRAVVDAAWERGLRHFDTAAFYAAGESERRLGLALAGRPRAEFVLSTKLGRFATPEGGSRFDYTAARTEAALAEAQARLGMARLDIVFLHDAQPDWLGADYEAQVATLLGGALPVLRRHQAAGGIGAIGLAMTDAQAMLRLLREAPFDVVMLARGCSLIDRRANAALLPHCAATGVPVLVAAPFETGLLATGAVPGARYAYAPAPPALLARTAAIEAVCARHGVALPAAALQHPLRQPAVVSVVVGHQTVAELAANVALLEQPIPAALWADLAALEAAG